MKRLVLLICLIQAITAADERDRLLHFENEVRPLLAGACYECHGKDKAKGGLRLDHITHIQRGGDSGPALVAGRPDESLLIEAVRRSDPDFAMPPKKGLGGQEVAVLEKWVREGAFWPEDLKPEITVDERGFSEDDYEWWAIQPVAEPPVPGNGKGWARNEIDRFVARKLEEKNLQPAEPAAKHELVRRAYFDLIGLPPTPEEVNAFLEDERPDAWARLIDRLLESPRYGERWAQHWLDVVRYSESDGYRADDYRPRSWRYRDYVIDSFNGDKPYDRFVREQLAGDEIAPHDPDTIIGTAFLRLGIYEWNQRNARMQWDLIMTEMTNATAEAFLGVGIGCAQCHDHKFDPILQRDHFALRSFLSSVWWPEDRPVGTEEELDEFERKMAEWERATAEIRAKIDTLQKGRIDSSASYVVKQFPEDIQEIYAKPTTERTAYEEQLAQLVQRQVDNKLRKMDWEKELGKKKDGSLELYKKLQAELAEFDHLKPEPLPHEFVATDIKPVPAKTVIQKRSGEELVEPAFLSLLNLPEPEIKSGKVTTGRRSVLAEWIADPENPLSTRVAVNRIWQRHFGKGIAPSPNDFGKLGGSPTHPELLDWLTRRFIEGGWRIKPIHRLIMNSATYRQTAQREPTSVEDLADPTNERLWRFPPRRLQAEEVRDAMLAVSGEIRIPEDGGKSVSASSTTRSVYTIKKRNTPDPFLSLFDMPAGFASNPDRVPTTSPNQSLLLMNGEWPLARASAFARRILDGKEKADPEVIRSAFQLAYGRNPSKQEVEASLGFIGMQMGKVTPGKAPAPKYPNENGLRNITQGFSDIDSVRLGDRALWIQPGSRFERLDFTRYDLPSEAFTIEAVANLDRLYPDASVNTLVSKWNGSKNTPGWSFGVTSEKSRYQPRNFIMQLVGGDFEGNRVYEVVASDLRFPLNKPVYVAAAVSAVPTDGDKLAGKVVFYLKDLSDPEAILQRAEVKHSVVGGLVTSVSSLVGGRDGSGHLWDGQLARLRISDGLLHEDELLPNGGGEVPAVIDWVFQGSNGEEPVPGTNWKRMVPKKTEDSRLLSATADFCQALFNSNEFLYLH